MKECDGDSETVLICDHVGCKMKFCNHGRLSAHKKRHDINVSINTKHSSGYADQTPTPIRFLRNCEEVGLFQDLQVNPFDETFRKAVEAAHSGHHPEAKEKSPNLVDDTLHTPKVFPIVNELQQNTGDGKVKTFCDVGVGTTRTAKKNTIKRKPCMDHDEPIESSDTHIVALGKNITFKLPIPKLPPCVRVLPHNFSVFSKNALKTNRLASPQQLIVRDKKLSALETNRLAQKRSREKRKMFYKDLIERNAELEKKVAALLKENEQLKKKMEEKAFLSAKQSKDNSSPIQHIAMPLVVTPDIKFLESCLPILADDDRTIVPTTTEMSQVVLRKPFKKRDIHPKLYLACQSMPNT